jgi:hypothetical protein
LNPPTPIQVGKIGSFIKKWQQYSRSLKSSSENICLRTGWLYGIKRRDKAKCIDA